jgi:Zn-dependent peptidase ImmA (M78 family)
MDRLSGATTFSKGRYLILVNGGDSLQRRRFTLAHEWKHLLDYAAADLIHAGLGRGDSQRQARQIEEIANYFAACLLMPKALLRRAWTSGLQDPEALAGLFDVSIEAMQIRLTYLGFINDEPDRPLKTYFRRTLSPALPAAPSAGGAV